MFGQGVGPLIGNDMILFTLSYLFCIFLASAAGYFLVNLLHVKILSSACLEASYASRTAVFAASNWTKRPEKPPRGSIHGRNRLASLIASFTCKPCLRIKNATAVEPARCAPAKQWMSTQWPLSRAESIQSSPATKNIYAPRLDSISLVCVLSAHDALAELQPGQLGTSSPPSVTQYRQ